jgi:hypothetical protein
MIELEESHLILLILIFFSGATLSLGIFISQISYLNRQKQIYVYLPCQVRTQISIVYPSSTNVSDVVKEAFCFHYHSLPNELQIGDPPVTYDWLWAFILVGYVGSIFFYLSYRNR